MVDRPHASNITKPKVLSSADPILDRETSFSYELWIVQQRAEEGEYVAPDELASLVEGSGDKPLPHWLSKQICLHLRGKVKRPRGRPSFDRNGKQWHDRMLDLARFDYRRILLLLQNLANRRRTGVRSRRQPRAIWDGPPHEVALKLVLGYYQKRGEFRNIDEPRFRNLISRQ